jgi:hypothetical protein
MKYQRWIPRQAPKPYVFITDANASLLEISDEQGTKRYRTVKGAVSRLERLHNKAVIYALIPAKQLILFGGAQNWKIVKYHGRVVRMEYDNRFRFHSWPAFGPDPQELVPFFDAITKLGIGPASMSTMAMNSWLIDLPVGAPRGSLNIVEWGSGPKIGRSAFMGGRKEALQPVPATYSGCKYLDLPAAYLAAMSDPIPMYLRETTEPRWVDEGICQAVVAIPQQSWNPLPFRIARGQRDIDLEVYAHGNARGIFVVSELRNAIKHHGVTAELERVWKGYIPKTPFSNWLPWAMELRKLPGASGLAAKQMTTRLWSLFGQNPARHNKIEITFEDKKGIRKNIVQVSSRTNPRIEGSAFFSAIIASRVRQRLLNELIPHGAVQVDTDGGIVPSTVVVPGWATKKYMDRVEIRSSQAYRWQCPDCPSCPGRHPTSPWHYSIAGFRSNDPVVPDMFERVDSKRLLKARWQGAIAIPAQTISEARRYIRDEDIEAVPDESL